MSDEQEDKIEKTFIDSLGAKYPMAKIKASDTQKYGIGFYPSVYCIAPDGTVHSVPDDRMPSEAVITQLLDDVVLGPALPEDSRYAPVRKMWDKKEHQKLGGWLAKMLAQDNLAPEMREVFAVHQTYLSGLAERKAASVAKLASGPDYFAARAKLARIEKEWKGFPAADAAKAELKRFAGDASIKKEIKAGKTLQKLLQKYDGSSQVKLRKQREALGKFAKKYAGTYAADQARKKLSR